MDKLNTKLAQSVSSKYNQDKEMIAKERSKMAGDEDSDDEYYDRVKSGKKADAKLDKPIQITETYETLKQKLETALKERSRLVNCLQKISSNEAASQDEDELEKYVSKIQKGLNEENKKEVIAQLQSTNKEIDECSKMLKYVTPNIKTADKSITEGKANGEPPKVKDTTNKEGLSDAINKLKMMENTVMKSVYEAPPEKEADEESKEPIIASEAPKQEANEEEDPGQATKNYFSEIVANLNKDTVDLKDYKTFHKRYLSVQKKTQELEAARGQEMNGGPGLQFFKFGDANKEKPEVEHRVYTASSKPIPRDDIADEEMEDTTKYI